MPALDKNTNLYAAVERVAAICKANKINLTSEAMAAAIVETVVNEVNDRFFTAKPKDAAGNEMTNPIDWFTSDAGKSARKELANIIKITVTACKNFQNSYAHPSGLMDKAVSDSTSVEFV